MLRKDTMELKPDGWVPEVGDVWYFQDDGVLYMRISDRDAAVFEDFNPEVEIASVAIANNGDFNGSIERAYRSSKMIPFVGTLRQGD